MHPLVRVIGFFKVMGFLNEFWVTALLIIWWVCRIHRCCLCYKIHPEEHWVLVDMPVVVLGVLQVINELVSSHGWTYAVVYLNYLVICELWWSMSSMYGKPLELAGIVQNHGTVYHFPLGCLWSIDLSLVDVVIGSVGAVVSAVLHFLLCVQVAGPSGVDVTNMLIEPVGVAGVSLTSTNHDKQSAALLQALDIHSNVML